MKKDEDRKKELISEDPGLYKSLFELGINESVEDSIDEIYMENRELEFKVFGIYFHTSREKVRTKISKRFRGSTIKWVCVGLAAILTAIAVARVIYNM